MASVLIIGSGGREHALAWSLSRSQHVHELFVAPGNGGTCWEQSSGIGLEPGVPCQNIPIPVEDLEHLLQFAQENAIDLTLVGPEVPLAMGIVNRFQEAGLRIFGPVAEAAQIEASKAFAKDFMLEQGIPTGEFFVTDEYPEAMRFLSDYHKPVVVKASGLAAGKGVIVCDTRQQAERALHEIMVQQAFGDAGTTIVIEERLRGREISVLAFCDGKVARPMIIARDYKRALDGNHGLNTGGMGAVAPVADISPALIHEILHSAILPLLDGFAAFGTPYVGVLYAGIMLTENGPKVLEYNCRFGDPETQVILPLLATDLYEILNACIDGHLADMDIQWHTASCATIICAAPGYPEKYPKNSTITGIESASDVIVFHSGTSRQNETLLTNGGRVLAVTAVGDNLDAALETAYIGVQAIHFDGMHYRTDIGAIYD